MAQRYCERCRGTMEESKNFYLSNNLEKYPDGRLNICKKCVASRIDNFNPETYLWVLQELDVPYVPNEWNKVLLRYRNDKEKLSSGAILGKYLSVMKIKQWRDYRWKDTEFLQEREQQRIEEQMIRQGYDRQAIDEVLDKATLVNAVLDAAPKYEDVDLAPPVATKPWVSIEDDVESLRASLRNPEPEPDPEVDDYFAQISGAEEDEQIDLTDEDRTYLRLKWGRTYKPSEWVQLEQLYNDMMESYDVQTAGHIDTLKLVCKTSLKANQLLDIGDIDGAQKVAKMYDTLMKSGSFTATQNKADNSEFIDSIGELIEMCERHGYIERFYIEQPNDKVDFTIQDMQRYTKTLIEEETNLSALLEQAVKNNLKEDEQAATEEVETEVADERDVSIEDIEKTITMQDYLEFEEFVNSGLEDGD